MITNFGKFMDPLADKLLVISALICFVENGQMAGWVLIILVGREFIISGFRLVAASQGTVIAAGIWGKLKTVVQMVMVLAMILNFDWMWYQICLLYTSPAIAGAALLTLIKADFSQISMNFGPYLLGFAVSALVGYLCIRTLLQLLKKNKFHYFGYYCGAVGLMAIIWGFFL